MQRWRRAAWWFPAVAAIGLLACSDSDPSTGSTTTDQGTETAEPSEPWPAPDNPMELAVDAGLVPETHEALAFHVHAHLDVFIDGEPIVVPAGIGIDVDDRDVRQFDDGGVISYGGIEECFQPCISPLHTHAPTGIVHTESATEEENTLGQFFIEWDQRLDEDCVSTYCRPDDDIAVYLDGELYDGDPADISLSGGLEIAIVIGTPPDEIPSTADFSQQ